MDTDTKVVGRRIRARHSIEEADALLGLAQVLRSGRAFVPRGVYRFKARVQEEELRRATSLLAKAEELGQMGSWEWWATLPSKQ